MKLLPLLAIGTALLVSSCASRYTALPPEAGVSPDPDALLKSMSTRLASARQYRITTSHTIPKEVAAHLHQQAKAEVAIAVSRPDKFRVNITRKGAPLRDMIFDGRTFTVVDGVNNFHFTTRLRGSLDVAVAEISRIFGFQPPLAEFIVSNPYRAIKHRVKSIAYLGKGTVHEGGRTVQCHRLSLAGKLSDGELWLGADDSLPRRLTSTRSNSGGKDLLVDIDFLGWDLNANPVGSSRVDLQACKLEYSIVSPK